MKRSVKGAISGARSCEDIDPFCSDGSCDETGEREVIITEANSSPLQVFTVIKIVCVCYLVFMAALLISPILTIIAVIGVFCIIYFD